MTKAQTAKGKKKKSESYKSIMKNILKSKGKSEVKDKKTIQINTGGGNFKQIEKI